MIIDARGRACPEPVLLTKKALASAPSDLEVRVDSVTARENVTRYAASQGYRTEVSEESGEFLLRISKIGK